MWIELPPYTPPPALSSRRCPSSDAQIHPSSTLALRSDHVRAAAHEYNLARNASLAEQLVRLSRLGKREPLRDERLDLLLLKEVEQSD
jgi:hypothetical protein